MRSIFHYAVTESDLRAAHTRCRVRYRDCPDDFDAAFSDKLYGKLINIDAHAAVALAHKKNVSHAKHSAELVDFKKRSSGDDS